MQPYLIASSDHVIYSIGSFELVWVQPSFLPPLRHWNLLVLTMCYFSDNVSSKENIKILWLLFIPAFQHRNAAEGRISVRLESQAYTLDV